MDVWKFQFPPRTLIAALVVVAIMTGLALIKWSCPGHASVNASAGVKAYPPTGQVFSESVSPNRYHGMPVQNKVDGLFPAFLTACHGGHVAQGRKRQERRKGRRSARRQRVKDLLAMASLGRALARRWRRELWSRLMLVAVLLILVSLVVAGGYFGTSGSASPAGTAIMTGSGTPQPPYPFPDSSGTMYGMAMVAAASKKPRCRRGAIYARFSTRFQHSIDDQVRTCQAWAETNDVDVLPEHVFSDCARTGKTQNRVGLDALLQALADDEVDVVIVFMTSRLYRRMSLALKFVEEEIVDHGKRCVFVRQSIDTEDKELWKPLLQVFALLDERQAAMQAAFIRAGHEGLLLKGWVHSTKTFGYYGQVIEGPLTRQGKPRTRWAIEANAADWVRNIFAWYLGTEPGTEAIEDTAIAWRLNHENAPPPPKSTTGRWSPLAVRVVLRNRRYIGDWGYGWTETV